MINFFLKKTLIFLAPILFVLAVFEFYSRSVPSNYSYKKEGLLKSKDSIQILFLGNSHSAYAFNPKEFRNAYNIAQVAQSIYFDKRILVNYIEDLKELKFVFIGIDFHSFYFSDQNQRNYWSYYSYGINYKDRLNFWKKNIYFLGYSPRVLMKNIREQFKLNSGSKRAVDVENGVVPNVELYNGFFSFIGSDIKSFADSTYAKRASYFNELVAQSTELNSVLKDLDELLLLLKTKNIKPILITTPCYAPYRGKLNRAFLNRNKWIVDSITQRHNIPYWNYFELNLDSTFYYNCDHLNIKGASMFSRLVSTRLDSLKNNIHFGDE
ncbi:MAG: hypothetical protein JNL24_12370 [Bacteroidia bacterium]|nr:hypothetical protein [Bacteroidia bacterium]